jgi:hypothetical protein
LSATRGFHANVVFGHMLANRAVVWLARASWALVMLASRPRGRTTSRVTNGYTTG